MFPIVLITLFNTWHASSPCDTVFRVFLICRSTIFVCHVPVRAWVYGQLNHALLGTDRPSVIGRLSALTSSSMWKLNRYFGSAIYFLFAVAMLTTIISWTEWGFSESVWLFRLSVLQIFVFIFHLSTSHLLSRDIFREDVYDAAMWGMGTDADTLENHTWLINFTVPTSSLSSSRSLIRGDECHICLHDFLQDRVVRLLSCSHSYHAQCIDTWLYKKKTCPVCAVKIDDDNHNQNSKNEIQQRIKKYYIPRADGKLEMAV